MSFTPMCRNARIGGRRTSIRMEPILWEALDDIAQRENKDVTYILSLIDEKREDAGLTSSVRAFIISYYYAVTSNEKFGEIPPRTKEDLAGGILEKAMLIFTSREDE